MSLVRPWWLAGKPVPPLVPTPGPPTWWQLVQLSIPAKGWGILGGVAAAGAVVGAAAGFVATGAGGVVGATVAAGLVGAAVGAVVGALVGAVVAAGLVAAGAEVAAGAAVAAGLVGTAVGVGVGAGAQADINTAAPSMAPTTESPRICERLRDFTKSLLWLVNRNWGPNPAAPEPREF